MKHDVSAENQQVTPRQLIVNVSIFIGVGCVIYAAVADFVPSQNWLRVGMYCVLALAVAYNAMVFLAYRPLSVERSKRASVPMIIAGYGFLQLILIAFFWPAVIYAAGGIFTRVAGSPAVLTAQIQKQVGSGRRVCSYQLRGEVFASAFRGYICVSQNEFASVPEAGELVLQGRRTVLGFYVEHIRANKPMQPTREDARG